MDLPESCQVHDHSASSVSIDEKCDDENNAQVNTTNNNDSNEKRIEQAGAILSRQLVGDNGNNNRNTTTSLLAQKVFFSALNNERTTKSHLLAASSTKQTDPDSGNKCGKCQNHEIEISKKGKYLLINLFSARVVFLSNCVELRDFGVKSEASKSRFWPSSGSR